MKPDGAAIHKKYRELGGYGAFIGIETAELVAEQLIVNQKLKIWIEEETNKEKPKLLTIKARGTEYWIKWKDWEALDKFMKGIPLP